MTVGSLRTPLALVVELLWAYAAVALFVQMFGKHDGPAPSMAIVGLAVIGSFALARALQASDFDEDTIRAIGLGVVAAAFLLALRLEYATGAWPWDVTWVGHLFTHAGRTMTDHANVVAGVIALTPLWLRGIVRGQYGAIEFDDLLSSASAGLIIVLIAAMTQPDAREPSSWGAYAFAYGLIAVTSLLVFRSPDPAMPLSRFVARWSWGIAALAGVAFGLALLAAAFDPDTFGFLAPVGEGLRVAAHAFGRYVLAPIFWVISLPFLLLKWVLDHILGDPKPREPQPAQQPSKPPEDKATPTWVQVTTTVLAGSAIIAAAGVVLLIVWLSFRRFAHRRQAAANVRYDDVEPASSLREDLAGLLGALAGRFRRGGPSGSRVAVRALYAEMLADAASAGVARGDAVSPSAFAPDLQQHYQSGVPVEISEAFVESRYGERSIDRDRIDDLRKRWHQLRAGET